MNKDILKLAIPNILTNLTVPLLGMVDMHLMGYQDSSVFMGAVALGGVIFNFVYWGFAFLRMSLSGMAAQAFGRNNQQEMAMMLFRGLLLAFSAGLLLLLLQKGVVGISLKILEGSDEVKQLASDYFYVRIWAAPLAISLMVINGWFLGMQNAIYPMIISITINVVNIASSFFFVKVLNMKVEGVALGSVVANVVGFMLSIILFLKKYTYILKEFDWYELIDKKGMFGFLNVSGDIFLRTLCIIIVFTFFTSKSAGNGDLILAANSALLQFLFLFSYFLDGFAYAAEALVGKFTGGRSITEVKRAVRYLFGWGFAFAFIFLMLYALGGQYLLLLFTNQQEVISTASDYLPWLMLLPLTGFSSFIWDGIYIGATASRLMRNTMLLATVMFFLLFTLLKGSIGNHALWLSMNAFMLSRGLFQTLFYKHLSVFRQ
ncbi:MATE family efflux transporter [Carboxylicivirga sediminis]|uniref:MATE family efflux transporter n=1 Tax=Carboxylicivirga sediminis TaxID=2006564 RepID=A0A941F645_9BACT|nr:MATE family efflux transporter [Carboxylicivirga sediminis]MBR8537543.1 MATE family efflux transporter [Carboxylicivirga sediminis]